MANFHTEQKQPNRSKYPKESTKHHKTPRVKTSEVSVPTHDGDLGILRIKPVELPRMSQANTMTTDGISHAMKNVMKKTGMYV
jgi:hypothetical protein